MLDIKAWHLFVELARRSGNFEEARRSTAMKMGARLLEEQISVQPELSIARQRKLPKTRWNAIPSGLPIHGKLSDHFK
jgi:hypothetical protein